MGDVGAARSILALRPGALGDALVTVPALRALRSAFPGAHLTLASHGGAARLLQRVDEVDAGLAFDDPSLAWLFGADDMSDQPDVLVAWVGEHSPLRQQLVHVSGRLVLGTPPRRDDHGGHAAVRLTEVLGQIGFPFGFHTGALEWPLRVRPHLAHEVLVHAGSGSRAKNWLAEQFAVVVKRLQAQHVPVRLVVGEADVDVAQAVEGSLGRALPRLELPSLVELAGRLAGCRAYLGNDSGVSHLAGLCGARTVAMFGPTDSAVWRPLGPRVTVLPFDADPWVVAERLLRD